MPQDTSREELPFLPGRSEFRPPSSMDAGLLRALFAPCEAPGEWKYKIPKFTSRKGPTDPQMAAGDRFSHKMDRIQQCQSQALPRSGPCRKQARASSTPGRTRRARQRGSAVILLLQEEIEYLGKKPSTRNIHNKTQRVFPSS